MILIIAGKIINFVNMSEETIKVAVRLRPLSQKELEKGSGC